MLWSENGFACARWRKKRFFGSDAVAAASSVAMLRFKGDY